MAATVTRTERVDHLNDLAVEAKDEMLRNREGTPSWNRAERIGRIYVERIRLAERGEDDRLRVAHIGQGTNAHYLFEDGYTVCGAGGTDRRFGPPVIRDARAQRGPTADCRRCQRYTAHAHTA